MTILVNNAGVVCGKTIIDSNDDGIEEVFKTNTLSNIWVSYINLRKIAC